MKKTAVLIMIITIVSKFFGFFRDIILSYFYGATSITDAYLISLTIPSLIFGFVGAGIASGYIPIYTSIEKIEGKKKALGFTNNLINILLVLTSFLLIFGLIFTGPLVKIFASGFTGPTLDLAVSFTRISLVGMYFTGLLYIFKSYLEIKGNYLVPALVGFPLNLITILAIALSSRGHVLILAAGSVLALLSQLLLLIPFAFREGFSYERTLQLRDPHIKRMVYMALPAILGTSVGQINVLVDRTLASRLAEGAISSLKYAGRINGFIQGIFVASIVTIMFPIISKMVADQRIKEVKRLTKEAMSGISLFLLPASLGLIIFTRPIVRLLYKRGQFGDEALAMTTAALFFYALGVLAFGFRLILSRVFYALQDTRTPAINASLAVVLNIILNLILVRRMGVGGLALATSLSAVFCAVLLFVNLRKKIGPFGIRSLLISFIKMLMASLIMGATASLSFVKLRALVGQNRALLLAIFIGAAVYGILIIFMKIEEVDSFLKSLKKSRKV